MANDAYSTNTELHEQIFKEEYAKELPKLLSAEKGFRNLVSQLMDGQKDLEKPKVASRTKDRDECIRKFKRKYIERSIDEKNSNIRSFISDIIGVRIICLYETDIPLIEETIRKEFDVFDDPNKIDFLQKDIQSFGYKAKHFDVRFRADRLNLSEYARFKDLSAEIQVRSIVQDAWSEVEHKLRYKKQVPDFIKRRIACLAALFELADREFASLHYETEKLLAKAKETIATTMTQLDAFSFLSILESMHPRYTFEDDKVERLFEDIHRIHKDFTNQELIDIIERNIESVKIYRSFIRNNEPAISASFNPYAEMRHILYISDRSIFHNILFERQRHAFDRWFGQTEPRKIINAVKDSGTNEILSYPSPVLRDGLM